jgi:type IV secretory pathway VirB4 component
VIDEAHRWLKNNPIALKTLELLSREIRHHKGVLILSTQNIGDFAGEPESILKQALYHIVLNMFPRDVTSYNELLRESGGLTRNEIDYILNAGIGEALISIGTQYRCYVTIKTNEIEEYM